MNAFEGIIKNGEIFLDFPVPLPDGTRVEISPVRQQTTALGMREEEWPTTPEGIAALLARMDQVETGWLSAENDAAWRADLQAQKQAEKTQFMEESEKLRSMWQ